MNNQDILKDPKPVVRTTVTNVQLLTAALAEQEATRHELTMRLLDWGFLDAARKLIGG